MTDAKGEFSDKVLRLKMSGEDADKLISFMLELMKLEFGLQYPRGSPDA